MLRRIKAWMLWLLVCLKFRNVRLAEEGEGCVYRGLSSTFVCPSKVHLGDNVHIGPGAHIDATGEVYIGSGSIFGPGVTLYSRSHNFDRDPVALPFDDVVLTASVVVGKYVWIGARAIILPGVTVGDGAVIGAGAVVTKDVPPCAVVAGNPARIVRYRDVEQFNTLMAGPDPFVYRKLGHKKRLIRK
ncbi:MAG: acyltransferase [Pseudomonadota bacterium]